MIRSYLIASAVFALVVITGCDQSPRSKPLSQQQIASLVYMNIEGIGDLPVARSWVKKITLPFGTAVYFDVHEEFRETGAKIKISLDGNEVDLGEVVVLDAPGKKVSTFITQIDYLNVNNGPTEFTSATNFRTTDRFVNPKPGVLDWQFDVQRLDAENTRIHAKATLDVSDHQRKGLEDDLSRYDLSTFYLNVNCSELIDVPGSFSHRVTVLHPDKTWPHERNEKAASYTLLKYETALTDRGLEIEYLVDIHSAIGPPTSLELTGGLYIRKAVSKPGEAKSTRVYIDLHTVMLWPWSKPKVSYSSEFPEGIPGEFDLKTMTEDH